jgi:hypothetical protein
MLQPRFPDSRSKLDFLVDYTIFPTRRPLLNYSFRADKTFVSRSMTDLEIGRIVAINRSNRFDRREFKNLYVGQILQVHLDSENVESVTYKPIVI